MRKPFQLIADLMQMGVFANVNQAIDEPTAKQLCAKNGFKFEAKKRQRDASAPAVIQEPQLVLDTEDEEEVQEVDDSEVDEEVEMAVATKRVLLEVIKESGMPLDLDHQKSDSPFVL